MLLILVDAAEQKRNLNIQYEKLKDNQKSMNVRRMFLLILRDDFLCNGKTGMETKAKTQLQKGMQ